MAEVKVEGKTIWVNEKQYIFEYEIIDARELYGTVFVVTDPVKSEIENLYGINPSSGDIWTVQSMNEVYPRVIPTSYVGVGLLDSQVLGIDFMGRRLVIDPQNGKILGQASPVK
jgi:hypothetical protein